MTGPERASEPPLPELAARLAGQLAARSARVGVVGLGYVGVPLALALHDAGFSVLGFDVNRERVAEINAGRPVIGYLAPDRIAAAVGAGFEATADLERLGEPDALLICVPTPLGDDGEPDLSFVVATVGAIARTLRPGQLVVLESTTWPGTTREVVRPRLEGGGLRAGRDFFLAFSPEREDPGNPSFGLGRIPKVIGADDAASLRLARALYEPVVAATVEVSDSAAAEAVKLTENVFRAVNIALVNELKVVFEALGIDVWEVVDAAATKPFGFMPFYPGPGLGGHCVPIDPFYLSWKARRHGAEARFIELAGEINTRMPAWVVGRLAAALGRARAEGIAGARVLLLGLAYKPNVDDTRESPSLVLMELLEERGASCDFHDPHLEAIPATRRHARLAGRRSTALDAALLAGYDAVLVATDHDAVDYRLVADHARLLVDTRNAFGRRGISRPDIVRA